MPTNLLNQTTRMVLSSNHTDMNAQKKELNNREISERELTLKELDDVSAGMRDNTPDAFAILAQAQAAVKSHGK